MGTSFSALAQAAPAAGPSFFTTMTTQVSSGFVKSQSTFGSWRLGLWFIDFCLAIASIQSARDTLNELDPEKLKKNHPLYITTSVFMMITFLIELAQRDSGTTTDQLGMIKRGILGFLTILYITGFTFAVGHLSTPESSTFTQLNTLGLFSGVLVAAILTLLFLQSDSPTFYFIFATAVISAAVLSIDSSVVRMRYYA